MGESVKYPAPTPALKDAADQVEVRKAFSDLSRVLEKKIVGEKTGSDPARGLYVEYTEGPNAQEIAAHGTIPIRDSNGDLPGDVTGDAHTVDGAHASATPAAGQIPILDGAGDGAFDITGNAATADAADTVNTANEAADTTCFPLFVPSATGQQEPKTNADFKLDSSTAELGVNGLVIPANKRPITINANGLKDPYIKRRSSTEALSILYGEIKATKAIDGVYAASGTINISGIGVSILSHIEVQAAAVILFYGVVTSSSASSTTITAATATVYLGSICIP